jgi:hypothetical protein
LAYQNEFDLLKSQHFSRKCTMGSRVILIGHFTKTGGKENNWLNLNIYKNLTLQPKKHDGWMDG